MDEIVHLAPLCGGLGLSRSRVEKWISDGIVTPGTMPPNGKARGWTKQDALRLACLVRVVDAGLRIDVGKAIGRIPTLEVSESEFLVILAYKNTIWRDERRKDGSLKPIDTGEHYDAFVTTKEEIVRQLDVASWVSLLHIVINLRDVRNDVERAWSYAASRRKAVD